MNIKHIGRYEIIGELGSGGMATVLLGKDSFMDREVAIKLLPRLFMHDPTFKERFQREAKLLAQLEHFAIVPVYDFGYHEEQPYMVNRYMRGGTLLERVSEHGALPIKESLTIISRICSALSAAHKSGTVHRDIKPANILFDDTGQAFIADFGIAKLAQSTSTLTGNTLVGTPAYMSPEQFSGEYKVDGRSDQYSLAIVLFEMLSGELPFKGDTTAKLMKNHLMDEPPSLRALRSDLPESIEPVVAKALQKNPDNRFPMIEAFQAALATAVQGEPWVSEAPQVVSPISKPAQVYQTNVLPEDVGRAQEIPPEPIREDVYATNIFPADIPLPSKPEEPREPEAAKKDQKKRKEKSKDKKKGKSCLKIGGFILLGIIVIGAIVIGVIWLQDWLYWRNYSPPAVPIEEEAATQIPEDIPDEPEDQPADTPEDYVFLSDGDYYISMDSGGFSTNEIVNIYDRSIVVGTLWDWNYETDPTYSCVGLELMSFPSEGGGAGNSVWHAMIICADGTYSLTEIDTDYETNVLSEGTIQYDEMYGFDFEMGCTDDYLYYYVGSDQGEAYEEIGHPCMDKEHYWGFNVYNETSIYVDTVEVWQIYE